MSFTRFYDDPCRIKKQLQESTEQGDYVLNVPGNGTKPCFMQDPFIRMQKWGANLQTNSIHLESELMGITRPYARDCASNNYKNNQVTSKKITYPTCIPFTTQPRALNPPWTTRDLEQSRWQPLHFNPQENIFIPFNNNLNTRILEKDYYVASMPCTFKE